MHFVIVHYLCFQWTTNGSIVKQKDNTNIKHTDMFHCIFLHMARTRTLNRHVSWFKSLTGTRFVSWTPDLSVSPPADPPCRCRPSPPRLFYSSASDRPPRLHRRLLWRCAPPETRACRSGGPSCSGRQWVDPLSPLRGIKGPVRYILKCTS